jgi:hypothetical protein
MEGTACALGLMAVGTFAALGPLIHPALFLGLPLRVDLLALTFLGALSLFPGSGKVGRWPRGCSFLVGGLLGAAFVVPWAAVPWLVVPAGVVARIGPGSGRARGWRGLRPGLALVALCANAGILATASAWGLRVPADEFESVDFPVNSLLADVPLHDVWAIELEGHPSPTLDALVNALRRGSPAHATPAVTGLGALRGFVGMAFGWEDSRWADADASFVHLVEECDRRRSLVQPGRTMGIWRVLYVFPREGAVETLNATVHVAVAASIEESTFNPRLFLSFRVREVNWTTRWYMRLIDPARRFFVYPALLRQLAHTWKREGGGPSSEHPKGEET